MYVPRHFAPPPSVDPVELIHELGFGVLFSAHEGNQLATSLPALARRTEEGVVLEGHLARANPQSHHVRAGAQALFVITGPHAHISPTWYGHVNVPTWNYVVVQVVGRLIPVEEASEVRASLGGLIARFESPGEYGLDSLDATVYEQEVPGILAFRLRAEQITPCFKLSQNRNEPDYREIVSRLERRGRPGDAEVAAFMRRIRPERT